jgi:hypothetical protein
MEKARKRKGVGEGEGEGEESIFNSGENFTNLF